MKCAFWIVIYNSISKLIYRAIDTLAFMATQWNIISDYHFKIDE